MGKSKLVDAVQRQAGKLTEILSEQAGKAAPVPHALKVSIVNVIWQLVGGEFVLLTSSYCGRTESIAACITFPETVLRNAQLHI